MTHEQIMLRAIDLAEENVKLARGGPFGAIVAKDGIIITEGTNLVTASFDPTAHAEIVTIRKACQELQIFQLTGYELFTSCEPCPMCLGAIYWARPDAVYYAANQAEAASAGFDDSSIYKQVCIPIEARTLTMKRILVNEAKRPFDALIRWAERIPY